MSFLDLNVHRFFDYSLVAVFALAPTVLGMDGLAGVASYVIGAGHLALSLFTGRGVGPVPWILPTTHAVVEAVLGVSMLALSWLLLDVGEVGQAFYPIVGVIILLLWLVTDYVGIQPSNSTMTSR